MKTVVDRGLAHCVLVTASDVDDENNVLWVSDFDFHDFERFLDKAGELSLPRETLRRDFFDEVGARPADIYKTTIQAKDVALQRPLWRCPDDCGTDADCANRQKNSRPNAPSSTSL